MIRFFISLSLALALSVAVSAQTKRPMTPEDVVSLNRASDAQIAYDGRRVAFVVSSWDRENDHPRWSPDLRRIAFLSDRGENGVQVYLINAMGGEPVALTSHKAPVLDFEWSPDGRYIAFLAEEPREKSKTKPPMVADEDFRYAQLWLV
jgi:Tol biopolymer transport system component